MTDFIHPALLFIIGALPIPFLSGSISEGLSAADPGAGDPCRAHDAAGQLW